MKLENRAAWFVIIVLLAGTVVSYGAVPIDTLRTTDAGVSTLVVDYLNSTNYYRGATNVTGYILNANPAGAGTFATINTGFGNYEHYAMDQNVMTGSYVNFSRVETDDFFIQNLNRTDALYYPEQPASYIIWRDWTTYYAKNGTDGSVTGYASFNTLLTANLAANRRLIVNSPVTLSNDLAIDNLNDWEIYFTSEAPITLNAGVNIYIKDCNRYTFSFFEITVATSYGTTERILNIIADDDHNTQAMITGKRIVGFGAEYEGVGIVLNANSSTAKGLSSIDVYIEMLYRLHTGLILETANTGFANGNHFNTHITTCTVGVDFNKNGGNINGNTGRIKIARGGVCQIGMKDYSGENYFQDVEFWDFSDPNIPLNITTGSYAQGISDWYGIDTSSEYNYTYDDAGDFVTPYKSFQIALVSGSEFYGTGHAVGWLVDANNEYACGMGVAPPDLRNVIRIWIGGMSIIAEPQAMMLDVDIGCGSQNQGKIQDRTRYEGPSHTTNFAADDYIFWMVTPDDDIDVSDLSAGDAISVKLSHEAASGNYNATNCRLMFVLFEYV